MSNTPNINIPMPDPTADVDDEFYRLRQAWMLVDEALFQLVTAVAGKSNTGHTHAIDQINGLATALSNKMAANKTFTFSDLTDVLGFSSAPSGYIPLKNAEGKIAFSSPAAAIGNHQHSTSDIQGLTTLIQSYVTALVNSSPAALDTLNELAAAIGNDPNFATTITNALAGKLSLAGGTMGGKLGLPSVSETSFAQGTGDGAGYATYNTIFKGWWGMGMATYDNSINGFYDFRLGLWDVKGGFKVNGNMVPHGGNKATAADIAAGTANKFPDAAAVKSALASFTSGQQTITNGGQLVIAHGLGSVPGNVSIQLVCVAADKGYNVGDIAFYPPMLVGFNGNAYGMTPVIDATNIALRISTAGFAAQNKTNGNADVLNSASWRLVVKAYP